MNISINNSTTFTTRISFINSTEAESIIDFKGKSGSSTLRYVDDEKVLYIGTGKKELSNADCRDAIANAIRLLAGKDVESLSITLPNSELTAAAVEGIILADYTYDRYLTKKKHHISNVELVNGDQAALETSQVIANGVCYSRDLINENAEIVTPEYLANEATKIAETTSEIELEILTEKELQDKGLGLLWAVGKGSATPPRLIVLNYIGNPESDERTALIGKGVTFDAGGLNMKPSGSIETMRSDMSGAAAVLGTAKALAELKPKINVTFVITSAQNAVSETAFFPGDIITGYDGTTVEVLNTDAEGRLCLADAISYVKENYEPTRIVNIATLTGAVVIALGDTIAGLFSNNDELKQALSDSGDTVGEYLWELPIRKEHHKQLKSSAADLQNIGNKARNASSITAAAFLNHFVGKTPWCHLDIAGVAWNGGEASGSKSKFATGFGVRLLSDFLLK